MYLTDGKYAYKVVRETKTLYIIKMGAMDYKIPKKTMKTENGGGMHTFWREATENDLKEIEERLFVNRVLNDMHEADTISYVQAVLIDRIINKKQVLK